MEFQYARYALKCPPASSSERPAPPPPSRLLALQPPGCPANNAHSTATTTALRSCESAICKGVPAESAMVSCVIPYQHQVGPLQTFYWDLRSQQMPLPDPTNLFKRRNVLCCYGISPFSNNRGRRTPQGRGGLQQVEQTVLQSIMLQPPPPPARRRPYQLFLPRTAGLGPSNAVPHNCPRVSCRRGV